MKLLICLTVESLIWMLACIKKVAQQGKDLTGTDVLILVLLVFAGTALLGFLRDRYYNYRRPKHRDRRFYGDD